jgi:hypothetical protein
MPHYSTWSRVLGYGVEPSRVEQIVGQFFLEAIRASRRQRGSIHLAIDGKTLRGTIPLGETEGVHVLAVYLPKPGVVLAVLNTIVLGLFARSAVRPMSLMPGAILPIILLKRSSVWWPERNRLWVVGHFHFRLSVPNVSSWLPTRHSEPASLESTACQPHCPRVECPMECP